MSKVCISHAERWWDNVCGLVTARLTPLYWPDAIPPLLCVYVRFFFVMLVLFCFLERYCCWVCLYILLNVDTLLEKWFELDRCFITIIDSNTDSIMIILFLDMTIVFWIFAKWKEWFRNVILNGWSFLRGFRRMCDGNGVGPFPAVSPAQCCHPSRSAHFRIVMRRFRFFVFIYGRRFVRTALL